MEEIDYKEEYEKILEKYERLKGWLLKNPFGIKIKFEKDLIIPERIPDIISDRISEDYKIHARGKKIFRNYSVDYLDDIIYIPEKVKEKADEIVLCLEDYNVDEHLNYKKGYFYLCKKSEYYICNLTKKGKKDLKFVIKNKLAVEEDGIIKPIYESKNYNNRVKSSIEDVEKIMLNPCILGEGVEIPGLFISPKVLRVYVCLEDKGEFKKDGVYTYTDESYYLGQYKDRIFTPIR